MTEYLGCDYANPALGDYPAFKKRGFSFIIRYLTPPGWWNSLTPAEALAIAAAGFGLVSVWETSAGAPVPNSSIPAGAAFFNSGRGAREGAWARLAAAEVGQPKGTPIYATVDYDMTEADWPAVEAYLLAFEQALAGKYLMGVYGSYRVIEQAKALTRWLWQTYAWSDGQLHPDALLYQFKNTGTIDYDRAFSDPGWWRPDGQPVVAVPAPQGQEGVEDDVHLTQMGDKGLAVKILQTLLALSGHALAIDGDFGPATLEAVKAFQAGKGLAVDGLVGPATWGALAGAAPKPPANQQELNDMATQIRNLTNENVGLKSRLTQIQTLAAF